MDKLIIGCGYVGKRVAEVWKSQGHRIYVTTRSPDRAEDLRENGFTPFVCDVTKRETLSELPTVSTVLYAVGMDRTAGHSMYDVYVQGLANVLEQLPRPTRFLYVSSTSVYGQFEGDEVNEETTPGATEGSGKVVLDAERTLREKNSEAIILRFAGIYGPGRVMRKQTVASGEPIVGNPNDLINLIHVDDGVQAIQKAEEQGLPGRVYNVCDGQAVSRWDLYSALAEMLGSPLPKFVPPSSENPAPRHAGNRRVSNQRMLEELGVDLKYPSYVEGMRAALQNGESL